MSFDTSLLLELLDHTRRFVLHINGSSVVAIDHIELYTYLRDHLRWMDAKLGLLSQNCSRSTWYRRNKLSVDSPLWAIMPTINRSRQYCCELARSAYRDVIIARLYAYDIIDGEYKNEEEIMTKFNEVDPCPSSSLAQPRLLDFAMRTNVALNDGSCCDVTSSLIASDNGKYAKIVERTIVDTVRRGVDLAVRLHLTIHATESLREEMRQLTEQVDREFSVVDQESSADLIQTPSLQLNEHIVSIVANNGSNGGNWNDNGDGRDSGASGNDGNCGDNGYSCKNKKNSDNKYDDDDGYGDDTAAKAVLPLKTLDTASSRLLKYDTSVDITRLREFDTQQRVLLISRERVIMDERVRCLTKTVEFLRNALNGTSDSILLAVQQATREMENRLQQQEQERQAEHKVRMARLHEQIALLKREQTTLHTVSDSVDTLVQIGESVRQSIYDTIIELNKASRELKAKNDFRERAMLNVEHRVLSIVRSYAHSIHGTSVLAPNILDYIHKMPYPRIINYDALIDIHVQFCLKHCSQLLTLAQRSPSIASSSDMDDIIKHNVFKRANFFEPSSNRLVDDLTSVKILTDNESSLFPVRRTKVTAKSVHLCRDRLVAFLFFYGNINTIDALRRLIARHEQQLQRRIISSPVEQRRRDDEQINSPRNNSTIRRSLRYDWSIFDSPHAMRILFGPQIVNSTLAYRLFLEEDWSELAYVPISVLRYICNAFELRWRLLHSSCKK